MKKFIITVAGKEHLSYVPDVENALVEASKVKGTGLAKRSAEYLTSKITEGKARVVHSRSRLARKYRGHLANRAAEPY